MVECVDYYTYLVSLINVGWFLKKSQHGFRKPYWFLPVHTTYDAEEMLVNQRKGEYSVYWFASHYFVAVKNVLVK